MKYIKLIILILIINFIQDTNAQEIDEVVCGDLTDYIPDANTTTKVFNVNVHIYNEDLGTGIYQNINSSDVQYLIDGVNTIYSNIAQPNLPVSPPAQHISDSKISFYLVNVYYHNNSSLYNTTTTNHYDFDGVNKGTEINIFYHTDININNPFGVATKPNYINMINMPVLSSSRKLAHELGHILGLPHTFGNCITGVLTCPDDAYLDTYYPDCNRNDDIASTTALQHNLCDPDGIVNLVGISNNLMGYNHTQNYLSPLQIAQMHLNASNLSNYLSKRKDITVYDANSTVTINSTLVWNDAKVLNGDLIINSGATLTIKCKAFFTTQGKIIVKAGGTLIVDGGNLTSITNNFWVGIYVEGTPSQDQFPLSTQGKCYIINNSKIEFMEGGIRNLHYSTSYFGGFSGSGGIIRAENSFFYNNKTSIQLYPYLNIRPNGFVVNDFSYINNCNFSLGIASINLIPDMQYVSYIKLNGVKGVRILGNEFRIDNSLLPSKLVYQRPTGILSVNSSFTLDDYCEPTTPPIVGPCTNGIQNRFYNLFYGIKAYNYNITHNIKVNNALFHSVYRGIYLSSVDNSEITNCRFKLLPIDITWNDNSVIFKQPYGLYLDGSTGFLVAKNEFEITTNYTTYDQNYGIIVNNSGDQTNLLYDNTFEDQYVGICAQNWNHSTIIVTDDFKNDGLKIQCNDFLSNVMKNVLIVGDANNTGNYGISVYQGKPIFDYNDQYMLAGNRFTNTGAFSDWDCYNQFSSAHVKYYCHKYDYIPATVPEWVPKHKYNISVSSQSAASSFNKGLTCPDMLTVETVLTLKSKLGVSLINWQSARLILSIWEDGGNTDLAEEVEGAYPWETYQVYNDLMIESPYLSDDVLIAAVNNTDVLPEALLKLILIANPHSISSAEVIEAIDNRIPALSQTTYDEIMGHIEDYSPLTDLKADVAYWTKEYYLTINDLKRNYISDSTNAWANDSLNALLSREDKTSFQLELASSYFVNNNMEEYNSVLNNLSDLQEDDILLKSEFNSFYNAISDFDYNAVANPTVLETNLAQLNTLSSTGKSKYANYARAILLNLETEHAYEEPIYDYTGSSARISNNPKTGIETISTSFKLYPNPAQEYITLDIEDNKYQNITLSIISSNGKIVKTIALENDKRTFVIDLSKLKGANYTFVIYSNNENIYSKNIQLIK